MYQLGNLISFHSTNDVDIVKKIERKGDKIYINGVNSSDVKPIPIDAKLLGKLEGVEYDRLSITYHLHSAGLSIDFRVKYDRIEKYIVINQILEDNAEVRVNINYLHDLQNLVFSLTQKKLIINTANSI